jgi:transcription-repair coupling factor (superfamily II helicase)
VTSSLEFRPALLDGVAFSSEGGTRIQEVVAQLLQRARPSSTPNRQHLLIAGTGGSAGALLLSALQTEVPLCVVCEDDEAASRMADDLGFFCGPEHVTRLTGYETSPYADVSPDRKRTMQRISVLAGIARGVFPVVVLPAALLVRKLLPKRELQAATVQIEHETEISQSDLIQSLSRTGFLRVPVVEDPGSFAVRGSLFDIWPAGQPSPVRVELYGDLVVSLKPFDAETQKAGEQFLTTLSCPPVRDVALSKASETRAREVVRLLADERNVPTSKVRALVEDVSSGRPFFGSEAYLPAHYETLDTLFSYVHDETLFVFEEPELCIAALRQEIERAHDGAALPSAVVPIRSLYIDTAELESALHKRTTLSLVRTPIQGSAPNDSGEHQLDATDRTDGMASKGLQFLTQATLQSPHLRAVDQSSLVLAMKGARGTGKVGSLGPLVEWIRQYQAQGLDVFVATRSELQRERLTSLLSHHAIPTRAALASNLPARLAVNDDGVAVVGMCIGNLARGVLLPLESRVFITEEEIFGTRLRRKRSRSDAAKARPHLSDLAALKIGDYVVHAEHGIGLYCGLTARTVGNASVDLLVVEYAGGDKLYLPVYRLNQVDRYAAAEGAQPKLDRLGGQSFSKTKARVAKAVREMADQLLRLYAERNAATVAPLPPPGDDYFAFEASFPFEETPDQASAIEAVNRDFEGEKPMDRLVCGDVGFGKTEVALRAAFRMAMEGKQVCVLCPTTVLAAQHARLFEFRMQNYPVCIRTMSRFQTKKEQDETLVMLRNGSCDIVIGTHRLLSKDVHFKDLGLLIVDEEQRFGVTHKERMKEMRASVHVLTLSATPIPRTLQMAVGGLRDLSLMTSPPADRRAVRTIVTRYDPVVLREAVERELSRGGQVFYVYNRIEGLYERASKLQALVPQARIAVAHGQMAMTKRSRATAKASEQGTKLRKATNASEPPQEAPDESTLETVQEGELEKTMLDFVDGAYDVLAATAIIESGLDIPRANTIIIDGADMFGLSQLYQLRGRVGRSRERAYCYLVVPPQDGLRDDARARIEALERNTELGSGFKIASLDLELRGAGDLLGREQSGNVASVGLEIFCQMLDLAARELRGEEVVHEVDPELSFDVEAVLPEDYVDDVGLRLAFYKRLASAVDEGHVMDIAAELENRFGAPPEPARRLIDLMVLKTELRKLHVLGCEATDNRVTLHLRQDAPLDSAKVFALVRAPKSPYKLTPDMRLTRRFEKGAALDHCSTMLHDLAPCVVL